MKVSSKFSNWQATASRSLLLVVCVLVCFGGTGCRALHPFAESTRDKFQKAKVWTNEGMTAMHSGRLQQAKDWLSKATKEDPSDFRARADLARSHMSTGDTSLALLEMEKAVADSSQSPAMTVELGEMYLAADRPDEARAQADRVLENAPYFSPAWRLLGSISKGQGNLPEGLAYFQKALRFAPKCNLCQVEIIDCYRQLNMPLRALSAIEQMLDRHPAHAQPEEALITKSEILVELNQIDLAIDLLSDMTQGEGASQDSFLHLGEAQLIAGKVSQARMTLKQGQQMFPKATGFGRLLGQLDSNEKPRVAVAER